MTIWTVLPAAAVCVSMFYYIAATVAAIRFARRGTTPLPPIPKVPPRVAVLKPLHGSSNSLAANLVSFLEIAYPRIDFYFGVHNYEDPAAEVPVALRQRYQHAGITLLVGEEPDCSNRKIAKLIRMADRAEKAEIFVLSDADVSVERDYLKRIVGELMSDEKIGIVTCAYRARPGGSFASRLEALYVNTDFLPQILLAEMIEPMHYALGATIAIKRKVLEAAGGFRAVKNMLADDFYLGNFTNAQGYEIKLSDSSGYVDLRGKKFRRILASSTALGAHLPYGAPDQHRDRHDAWSVLGADTAGDDARKRSGPCDFGAGRGGAARDVGGDSRPRAQDARDAERTVDGSFQGSDYDRGLVCQPVQQQGEVGGPRVQGESAAARCAK